MHIQPHFGVGDANAGAFLLTHHEIVGNGVLYAIGDKARVTEFFTKGGGIDSKRGFHVHDLTPVIALHLLVEVVGIGRAELEERLKDAQRGVAAEVGTVHHFLVSGERHHASAFGHVSGPQGTKFIGEHTFQPLESLGHHLKFFSHFQCILMCDCD